MIVGYPTPGKEKAVMLLTAFCQGAGGTVANKIPKQLLPGAAAFYGVVPETKHLFDQCLREQRDYFYMDNAYLDSTRGKYFRVTKNRLQHPGLGESNGERWAALKIPIHPWRAGGSHILVCPQSGEFMRDCAQYEGAWLVDTIAELQRVTTREIRIRTWTPDKIAQYRTLPEALRNAHALVTYSSASAISAILSGVPAFTTAADAAARPMSGHYLAEIEAPLRPDNREGWAKILADNQWTIAEMENGVAWEMLAESSAIASA